jgi:hypothetical protein
MAKGLFLAPNLKAGDGVEGVTIKSHFLKA